jgi:hypothetical protein
MNTEGCLKNAILVGEFLSKLTGGCPRINLAENIHYQLMVFWGQPPGNAKGMETLNQIRL